MTIDYVITKSNRKSISVTVSNDFKVMVKAPAGTPTKIVEDFLYSKRDWIIKQIQKKQDQQQLAEEMGFIGPEEMKEIKKKARKLIPERVEYYAGLAGIKYNRIFIRLQKSRWGSCSVDGNLNFNCLLVLMPLEALDSVVVHELCHRLHMDHSKAFYADVYSIFPEYKKWDKWLKVNGPAYFRRLR